MSEFTVPCEGCGDRILESEALIDTQPAYRGLTTIAWCPDCQKDDGGYA